MRTGRGRRRAERSRQGEAERGAPGPRSVGGWKEYGPGRGRWAASAGERARGARRRSAAGAPARLLPLRAQQFSKLRFRGEGRRRAAEGRADGGGDAGERGRRRRRHGHPADHGQPGGASRPRRGAGPRRERGRPRRCCAPGIRRAMRARARASPLPPARRHGPGAAADVAPGRRRRRGRCCSTCAR